MAPRVFKIALAVFAAALIIGLSPAPLMAGSIDFTDFGWRASWDPSFDNSAGTSVSLTPLNVPGGPTDVLVLEKVGRFASPPDQFGVIHPLEINFEQISPDAVSTIAFVEQIKNATGVDWTSFRIIIEGGSTGTSADPQFDEAATFGGATPWNIAPFTTHVFSGLASSSPQVLDLGGGTVANDEFWRPGIGDDAGFLIISAAPSDTGTQRFVFKELPNPGGSPAPIPLPAAMWTSLSSLVGLGLMSAAKRVRKSV